MTANKQNIADFFFFKNTTAFASTVAIIFVLLGWFSSQPDIVAYGFATLGVTLFFFFFGFLIFESMPEEEPLAGLLRAIAFVLALIGAACISLSIFYLTGIYQ